MNPYNTLDQHVKSDVIDFVPPDAQLVRLVQLGIWKIRLDCKQGASGESPIAESSKGLNHGRHR